MLETEEIQNLLEKITKDVADSEASAVSEEDDRNAKSATEKSAVSATQHIVENSGPLVINLDDDDDDDDAVESMKENIDTNAATILKSKQKPIQNANLKRVLRKMTRPELEELITEKVVQCLNAESTIGMLKQKVGVLTAHKDRLFNKSISLQKQVSHFVSFPDKHI